MASSSVLPPGLSLSPAGDLAGTPAVANQYAFFVAVADSTGAVALAMQLTVMPPDNPVPSLTGVSPGSVVQGADATDLVASGLNFVPTAAVFWDGAPLATTFVGPTKLVASIPCERPAAGRLS